MSCRQNYFFMDLRYTKLDFSKSLVPDTFLSLIKSQFENSFYDREKRDTNQEGVGG